MIQFLLRFLRVLVLHFFLQAFSAFFFVVPFFFEVVDAQTGLQLHPRPTGFHATHLGFFFGFRFAFDLGNPFSP
jgi:hypothetical protein